MQKDCDEHIFDSSDKLAQGSATHRRKRFVGDFCCNGTTKKGAAALGSVNMFLEPSHIHIHQENIHWSYGKAYKVHRWRLTRTMHLMRWFIKKWIKASANGSINVKWTRPPRKLTKGLLGRLRLDNLCYLNVVISNTSIYQLSHSIWYCWSLFMSIRHAPSYLNQDKAGKWKTENYCGSTHEQTHMWIMHLAGIAKYKSISSNELSIKPC